jgi:hypothetical protein
LKKSHYRIHKLFRFSSGDGEVNKLVAFTITRCGLDDGRFTLGNGAAGIPVSEGSGHTDAAGVGTVSAAEAGVTNTHSNDSLTSIQAVSTPSPDPRYIDISVFDASILGSSAYILLLSRPFSLPTVTAHQAHQAPQTPEPTSERAIHVIRRALDNATEAHDRDLY